MSVVESERTVVSRDGSDGDALESRLTVEKPHSVNTGPVKTMLAVGTQDREDWATCQHSEEPWV